MTLARPLLLAACLAALAGASPSRAERVDLTEYLAPRPIVGDYVVYAYGSGGEERYEVTAVDDLGNGWRVLWERNPGGGTTYAEIVRPGIKIRRATREDETPPGCRRSLEYELRGCALSFPIGGARSFRVGYLDTDINFPFLFFWTRMDGRYGLAGFEPLETPYAAHEDAARIVGVVRESRARVTLDRFEVSSRGPLRLRGIETRQSWYVAGVGLVALRVTPGKPEESATSTPTQEMWLKEARVQGIPYP